MHKLLGICVDNVGAQRFYTCGDLVAIFAQIVNKVLAWSRRDSFSIVLQCANLRFHGFVLQGKNKNPKKNKKSAQLSGSDLSAKVCS